MNDPSERQIEPNRETPSDGEEPLAIFLKIIGENASNRMAQERFQQSGDTISRVFYKVLDAVVELYTAIVKQPDASQFTPLG